MADESLLVGAYAFSHDGMIYTPNTFNKRDFPQLQAVDLVAPPPPIVPGPTVPAAAYVYKPIGALAFEGAVGHMVFSGGGYLRGSLQIYKHGIYEGKAQALREIEGTYTVRTREYRINPTGAPGAKNTRVATVKLRPPASAIGASGTRIDSILVHEGEIVTTDLRNGVQVEYYFVAADNFNELRFMIIKAPAAFFATGTLRKFK